MITFIAFVLTILGCVNWLLIGMLQYDFIAGLFGFQASMFSRIVYIIFGVASAYLVLRVILNKGTFKVWEKKKKKTQQENTNQQPAYANVEASQEQIPQKTKKKKWWQFWKKSEKKNKNKTQENNMAEIDVDVSLNATPEHFNEHPSIQSSQNSNTLFDEHFHK